MTFTQEGSGKLNDVLVSIIDLKLTPEQTGVLTVLACLKLGVIQDVNVAFGFVNKANKDSVRELISKRILQISYDHATNKLEINVELRPDKIVGGDEDGGEEFNE